MVDVSRARSTCDIFTDADWPITVDIFCNILLVCKTLFRF